MFQNLLPILPILFSLIPLPFSRLLFAARKKAKQRMHFLRVTHRIGASRDLPLEWL
jgi:hypothetical protein